MLHVASVCTPCCMLLDVVAQSLKPVKLFNQQLPTFLLFRDRRSVAQQCWIRLRSSSNIVGATHAHYAWFTKTNGCILPTMLCRSQHCWELLHRFAHHCQHARSLRHGKSGKKGRPSFRQLPLVLFLCSRLLNSRTQLSRRLQRAKIFHEGNGNCMFVE